MNWGLFSWRWFAGAVLLLSIFSAGYMAGKRQIEQKWDVERLQQQAAVLEQSVHMAQVQTQQERINQKILSDYESKKILLARPSTQLSGITNGLCVPAAGLNGSVSANAECAASADASPSNAVSPSRDAITLNCEKLENDAIDTTLMLLAFQRWYEEQSRIKIDPAHTE
jgi:hypothetical protein